MKDRAYADTVHMCNNNKCVRSTNEFLRLIFKISNFLGYLIAKQSLKAVICYLKICQAFISAAKLKVNNFNEYGQNLQIYKNNLRIINLITLMQAKKLCLSHLRQCSF